MSGTDQRYEGAMPDSFFRILDEKEEKTFRQHARDNWTPDLPENFSMFHPVVRDEWRKIDEEKIFFQCDVCGRMTCDEYLESVQAYGIETIACDICRGGENS